VIRCGIRRTIWRFVPTYCNIPPSRCCEISLSELQLIKREGLNNSVIWSAVYLRGVSEGCYYYEVSITPECSVRVGWATKYCSTSEDQVLTLFSLYPTIIYLFFRIIIIIYLFNISFWEGMNTAAVGIPSTRHSIVAANRSLTCRELSLFSRGIRKM